MSFLRLRDAPNIHTLVGLRKLELSENNLSSIQVRLVRMCAEQILPLGKPRVYALPIDHSFAACPHFKTIISECLTGFPLLTVARIF